MSDQQQALKDFCLSQPDKSERVSTYEFFFKLKHEIRMEIREREQQYRDNRQTYPA